MAQARKPTVLFPAEWIDSRPVGTLHGYHHPETGYLNVLHCGPSGPAKATPTRPLGVMSASSMGATAGGGLRGYYDGGAVHFTLDGSACDAQTYSLAIDIFSRNSGILETPWMLESCAIISGCGSVGSLVALELARAGVGRFVLVDNDVLAYHNVCRHQCGISDVGQYKTDALRDRILDINPAARVESLPTILEDVPAEVFERTAGPRTIIIGAADNRQADLYANKVSCLFRVPFVSIGLWERAFAGEVFWSLPGLTPCYYCIFGLGEHDLSFRPSKNRRVYTTEEDLTQVQFEPGISTDLTFVTTIGIKFALDLLTRHDPGFHPKLLGSLTQFTLACNTNDPRFGGDRAEIFDHPLQVTRSIKAARLDGCPHCRLVDVEPIPLSPPVPAPAEAAAWLAGPSFRELAAGFRQRSEFSEFLRLRWSLSDEQVEWCSRRMEAAISRGAGSAELTASQSDLLSDSDRELVFGLVKMLEGSHTFGSESTEGIVTDPSAASPAGFFPEETLAAFRILSIEPTLHRGRVSNVFRKFMKLLHPDTLPSEGISDVEKREAAELARRVIGARETLDRFYGTIAPATPDQGRPS